MESVCVGGVVSKLRNGMFEIDDRGDAVAEIHLNGDFGEISKEDVSVWAEWDRQLNREPIKYPAGLKVTSMIIGFVHGLTAAPMDEEGNYVDGPTSAFPGLAHINGASQGRVESLQDLERYLEENIGVVFNRLIRYGSNTTRQ